jgi:hypothetical protein
MTAAAFIDAARSYQGAVWAHQGRRHDRMDCIGLLVLSMGATGRLLRDRTDYGMTPHLRKLRAELIQQIGPPVTDPCPGDVVTLRWSGEERHVAIVTDHPEGLGLIHCWRAAPGAPVGGGKVVEHRLDEQWRRRIVDVFRPDWEGT